MRVGSLFSGIGGIDLGLERAGFTIAWQCEIDPFCRRVLAKHWPDVPCYGDVRDVGSEVEWVDLICGGFPCQPVSLAGKRQGQDDERWLWPEFGRIVRELRPRYVLVENVPGLLVRGMGDVLGDLAACGYDAEWDCIPAVAVGAPHRRDRVWIVAYPQGQPGALRSPARQRPGRPPSRSADVADADGRRRESERLPQPSGQQSASGRESDGRRQDGRLEHPPTLADTDGPRSIQQRRIFASRPQHAAVQLGCGWRAEPDVGRVASGVPARVDRLRSLGNAVVPQVVEYIGRRILEVDRG